MLIAGLRIISGGQTGVDRAALDVALELALPCGGYCPKGRLAEDGPIAARYPLTELPSAGYPARTRKNVEAAAATLILHNGVMGRGTALTRDLCRRLGKPFCVVGLGEAAADPDGPRAVVRWIRLTVMPGGGVLNVAGPRESGSPGVGAAARAFLTAVLSSPALARGADEGDGGPD